MYSHIFEGWLEEIVVPYRNLWRQRVYNEAYWNATRQLGNSTIQISSLTSWEYIPNVHKFNCKHFWGRIPRYAGYGLAGWGEKKRAEAELNTCLCWHSTGSHTTLCHPGACWVVCRGVHSPRNQLETP